MILVILRFTFLAVLIPIYLFIAALLSIIVWNPIKRHRILSLWLHYFCPIILGVLGINRWVDLRESELVKDGTLIVANHLSYLDVLIISAALPVVFVTSKEVRDDSFLGILARAAGSIFVERRSRMDSYQDNNQIKNLLTQGLNVVVFPEGTSSSGSQVLPFKSSFFQSVIHNRTMVLPLCINYLLLNDKPVSRMEADTLFYYGEMIFGQQLLKLCSIYNAWVEITVLPAVTPNVNECRKQLTTRVRNSICSEYKVIRQMETEGQESLLFL